jgi:glycosyltransferase involved in cell wall biosynthesis
MVDQMKAFAVFVRAVSRITRNEQYDLVFATSSRLMTAALGAWVAMRKRAVFYADIRDIFVDTINDVIPGNAALPLKPVLSGIERFAVSRADKVNLVSEGFADYFQSRYPRQKFSFFTNGIDEEFIGLCPPPPASSNSLFGSGAAAKTIRVLYAGNMGEGQGLHHVMPGLATAMHGRAEFRLIGDGGRRRDLSAAVEGLDNVEVIAPMDRASLIEEYRAADVLFLHLNNYDAFKKVLPSKIFEYAATGKPIWAGVAGYSADFLHQRVENAVVFPPLDVSAALTAFDRLRLECVSRAAFVSRYSRRQISAALAADIVSVIAEHHG